MRVSHLIVAGLTAALLATTGCGRVSSVQPAMPAGGAKLGRTAGGAATPPAGYQGATPIGGTVKPKVTSGPLLTSGNGTVSGRVLGMVDESRSKPLAGVVVTVQPGGIKLVTRADGSFSGPVPAGNYTFSARTTGFQQVSTNGTLVEGGAQATVPDILMVPGEGPSGITSIKYVKEADYGRVGEPPATLVEPQGVAVRGGDVLVLDINQMPGVKTGIIRQYQMGAGTFAGKYGDYTKWLGRNIMRDTVKAIALDATGRALVLDGARQIWRFKPNGDKDAQISVDIDNGTDIAVSPTGEIFVAHAGGVTKFNSEAQMPQPLGNAADCRAVAAGKDSLWVITGANVAKLGADGTAVLEFGAGGTAAAKGTPFADPADLAVDPKTGNVVVVDQGTKNVYVYDAVGTLIGKVGDGTFEEPSAVTVDDTGRVFVLDAKKKKLYQFAAGQIR